MKLKKILFLVLSIVSTSLYINPQKVPVFIHPQQKVFKLLAQNINAKLPNNIDILFYDTSILNGTEKIRLELNENYFEILKNEQAENNFNFSPINKIMNESEDLDFSFIQNYDEKEYIAFGKFIDKDAVAITSITLIDKKTKKKWNKFKKDWEIKKIALLQVILFNTNDGTSILRYTSFFLIR